MRTQKKVRAHKVLFTKDTPFKQKVVVSKTAYKRRPKHKGQSDL